MIVPHPMSITRSFLNARPPRGDPPAPAAISIEGYQIEALLGSGPLTATYRGILESHQHQVVIKVLLPHLARSELFVQRFLKHASTARLVTHDRVLPCYDVGQSNGWVYIACEHVAGGSLADLLRQGPLDPGRAVYLAWQAAMGLEAIHGAGLVHGNLRLSNILVDDEDGVRLADHGLPSVPEEEQDGASSPALLHLPPEAAGAAVPTPSWDIYALSVVIATMVTGAIPRANLSPRRLAELRRTRSPLLDSIPPDALDAELAAVVACASAADPGARYDQAWRLREDLERLQYGFSPMHAGMPGRGAAAPAPARQGDPPRRRRRWPWAVAGVLVLGSLGAMALALVPTATGPAVERPPVAPGGAPVETVPVAPPAPAAAAAPAGAVAPAIAAAPAQTPVPPPPWAAASGSDGAGRWADLAVAGRTYRLRLVRAGSFWMGSPADEIGRAADEDRHLVTLTRGFWLGEAEVDQDFFAAIDPQHRSFFQGPNLPVESLSWNGVQTFLAELGGRTGAPVRLPTEAEWEMACRAAGDRASATDAPSAWTAEQGLTATKPVRSSQPNAWGFYDLQGNVMEWVEDTYGRYRREAGTDPLSTGGVHRVLRGGSWNLGAEAARPAARSKALVVTEYSNLGFRIAITE